MLPCGESGYDHLIERQGKGEHPTGEQSRAEVGQQNVPEGLERICAKIGRGIQDAARQPSKPSDGVVIDDNDAKGGMANDNGTD